MAEASACIFTPVAAILNVPLAVAGVIVRLCAALLKSTSFVTLVVIAVPSNFALNHINLGYKVIVPPDGVYPPDFPSWYANAIVVVLVAYPTIK